MYLEIKVNMSIHTCERCGHESTSKSNLLKHLRRKTPCESLLSTKTPEEIIKELLPEKEYNAKTYQCVYCCAKFNSSPNKYRHQRICKKKPSETDAVDETTKQMQKEIELLKKQVQSLQSAKEHRTVNNNTNNGTINNIVINTLGRENISYLTKDSAYNTFMVKCIKSKVYGLMDFLVQKHFHPDHPENHNIRKLNKKDDFIEVHVNKEWQTRFADDVLESVFNYISSQFANFVEEVFSDDGGMLKQVWLDEFAKCVGHPLNWDLSFEDYDIECHLTQEKRDELRERIYKLAIEHIYKKSQEVHNNSG